MPLPVDLIYSCIYQQSVDIAEVCMRNNTSKILN